VKRRSGSAVSTPVWQQLPCRRLPRSTARSHCPSQPPSPRRHAPSTPTPPAGPPRLRPRCCRPGTCAAWRRRTLASRGWRSAAARTAPRAPPPTARPASPACRLRRPPGRRRRWGREGGWGRAGTGLVMRGWDGAGVSGRLARAAGAWWSGVVGRAAVAGGSEAPHNVQACDVALTRAAACKQEQSQAERTPARASSPQHARRRRLVRLLTGRAGALRGLAPGRPRRPLRRLPRRRRGRARRGGRRRAARARCCPCCCSRCSCRCCHRRRIPALRGIRSTRGAARLLPLAATAAILDRRIRRRTAAARRAAPRRRRAHLRRVARCPRPRPLRRPPPRRLLHRRAWPQPGPRTALQAALRPARQRARHARRRPRRRRRRALLVRRCPQRPQPALLCVPPLLLERRPGRAVLGAAGMRLRRSPRAQPRQRLQRQRRRVLAVARARARACGGEGDGRAEPRRRTSSAVAPSPVVHRPRRHVPDH
jgi:hypothetical protein